MKAQTFVFSLCLTFRLVAAADYDVHPIPERLRTEQNIDLFYAKMVDCDGLAILGSNRVSDDALREAAWILKHMLEGREDICRVLVEKGVHVAVMGSTEYTTDIPEHRHLKPRIFWDRRARGLGGSPVSCGEENLLGFPGDPYSKENLLIHEFSHAVHNIAMKELDPTFDQRLNSAYDEAKKKGLWKGTYAGSNHEEYWAEAVQSWFDNNRENDALHNHVNTRSELQDYDAPLAALCAELFGNNQWRYRKPIEREPDGRAHLLSYQIERFPRFQWRNEPIPDKPRVLIQTELGDIEVELDAKQAPKTVRNFVQYVHLGFYNDGVFFRTVTANNQPDDKIKIEVIQAQADPTREDELESPIVLERTRDTGLRHKDGTISMARLGPDTGQHHFFICVGDQPELDFDGQRNPDGQGFAAFGQVVKGFDVVHKIHISACQKQTLTPPIRIQRAIRLN